jgi:hypothetical protein
MQHIDTRELELHMYTSATIFISLNKDLKNVRNARLDLKDCSGVRRQMLIKFESFRRNTPLHSYSSG